MTTETTADFEDLFETIDKMTVIELADFVNVFEKRFGVVAQPTVTAIQPTRPSEATETPVEEQTEFSVVLTEAGQNRISVIKLVKEVTSLGLADSKALVDALPKPIKQDLSRADAETLMARFVEAGATVEVQ